MRRIDTYLNSQLARHRSTYRMLRQVAKAALVSMLFFSASFCSSASAAAGDGLPPDCCHFLSEADMGSLVADFSNFRSTGRTRTSMVGRQPARQPMVGIMIEPSSRHWKFDYQVSNHRVGTAPAGSVAMKALAGFGLEASMFQSLKLPQSYFEFALPLETQAELSILKQAFVAEARALISANLLQHASPLPIRALQIVKRAIWEL